MRTLNEMVCFARRASQDAYAPYSKYKVGAAIELDSGVVVTGCNVENASYGLTICAERTAIVSAVAKYGPDIRIVNVTTYTSSVGDPGAPCGACRQFIAEFADDDCVIYSADDGNKRLETTLGELLPHAFRLDKLEV